MLLKKIPNLLYLDGRVVIQSFILNQQEVTMEERERMEIIGGIEKGNMLPNIHIPQVLNSKVPVKLSSINFEGVFSNVKVTSDNVI